MIKSFKDKESEKIFNGQFSSKLPESIWRTALRKLTQVHGAATLGFVRVPPANRLEKLTGKAAAEVFEWRSRLAVPPPEGQWSIGINDRWRICFEWRDGDADDVEITDYH